MLLDVRPQDAGQHLVELLAVPPAVHVGLARAEGTLAEYPLEEALIVYPDVPRTGPVYLDIRALEQLVNCPLIGEAPAHRGVAWQSLRRSRLSQCRPLLLFTVSLGACRAQNRLRRQAPKDRHNSQAACRASPQRGQFP